MEAAETEVEEGRRDEGEECEEEKEPEDGAGREEAIEASEKKVRGCRGALGGGEERERRRLPPGPEEDPPHSLRFSWRSPRSLFAIVQLFTNIGLRRTPFSLIEHGRCFFHK